MPYTISVYIQNLELVPKLEQLKKEDRLSNLINELLTEYFNKDKILIENKDFIEFKSLEDIENYFNKLKEKGVKSSLGFDLMKEGFIKRFTENGSFIVDLTTGRIRE